ncbi:DUF4174 domain-containing protein [Dyadobacter sp. CY345]|uniref:DUF4174 domain-containing protein n=1 Tax=Dyadobacter sp. CY345 TaxID=2909335 RepID=UPI001F397287|nr:DUF4174 domain-containing protein [Dyadobacter sp. CY345]MCF2443195.1 DUF4174 domain-containing protein [Dyadobacter sp. CY345]
MKILLITMMLFLADQPRKVLLFYKNDKKETWHKQTAELEANKAGVKERDINIESYEFSKNPDQWKKWNIDTSKSFTFILIGRDGGEKHRSDKVVSHQELFGKIDAMPMRKNEIR